MSSSMMKTNPPAFPGARFDAGGYCVAHPKTRLCKLTDDGKYKIVRKTCQRCGSAALASSITRVPTQVHGYKKKDVKHREVKSQGLLIASDTTQTHSQKHATSSGHRGSASKHKRSIGRSQSNKELNSNPINDEKHRIARGIDRSKSERQSKTRILRQSSFGTKTSTSSDASKAKQEAPSRGRTFAVTTSRRGRTMSPALRIDGTRRGRTRTLSPMRQTPTKPTTSNYFRKVSEELAAHSPRHVKQALQSMLRSSKVLPTNEDRSSIDRHRHPFDCRGYCSVHTDVQLAKKDRGSWTVIQDSCPLCTRESSHKSQRSNSSTKRKTGKVGQAIKQLKSSERADDLSCPQDPNEMALVVADATKAHPTTSRALVVHETAIVPVEEAEDSRNTKCIGKTASNVSPTSVTQSPSNDSHPSPAFSSTYFSGTGTNGFPTLPLIADDLNVSHATIKHRNGLNTKVGSNKRKPRSVELKY